MMYPVVETFKSIQSEGGMAGTCAFFIRLFGCNLKCNFGNGFVCDEPKHKDKGLVKEIAHHELARMAVKSGAKHVVITGGEPTLHNLAPLIAELHRFERTVQVETNGLNFFNAISADWITYSPKGRFSPEGTLPIPNEIWKRIAEVKLLGKVGNLPDPGSFSMIPFRYVQPIANGDEWDIDNVKACAQFVMDNPGWQLSLQTHKLIGLD